MTTASAGRDAGVAWEELTAQRRDGAARRAAAVWRRRRASSPDPGAGQVTLDWEPVDGAAGYLVRRADRPDGDFAPLEIGEPWVRPVPHPPLTDTTGTAGVGRRGTRVAAVAAVDDHDQPSSPPIAATPLIGRRRRVPHRRCPPTASSDRSTARGGR